MRSSIRTTLVAVLAALALLLAACGDDDTTTSVSGDATGDVTDDQADVGAEAADSEDDGDQAAFPATVSLDGAEVTIDAEPRAIVSLSPTATEMLFAIGAGDQVVAVDEYSNHPAEAPTTDLSGFEPNVEAIIGYEPDLVILSGDRNDVIASLAAVDVPAMVLPAAATIDDTYTQIEVLGAATGHVGGAAEVVAGMQADIEELVAQVPARDERLTYYHELDDTLYSVTSQTFIGELYALAGLDNIADAADPDGAAGGYPQLSAELIIDADPDVIFLADAQYGQTVATVSARPGFDQLTAVQQGNVIELEADVPSRWGPRIVDLLRVIIEATADIDTAVSAG